MEAGRFAVLSEDAATNLLLTKDTANTKKANLRAYRTFRSYLNERNYDKTNFEEWETARLDEVLAKFYSEARTEKGELYKTTTLYSLRYSLNRYLTDYAIKEKKPVVDITNKESFPKSNEMFKACCKMLKKEGKASLNLHPLWKKVIYILYQHTSRRTTTIALTFCSKRCFLIWWYISEEGEGRT